MYGELVPAALSIYNHQAPTAGRAVLMRRRPAASRGYGPSKKWGNGHLPYLITRCLCLKSTSSPKKLNYCLFGQKLTMRVNSSNSGNVSRKSHTEDKKRSSSHGPRAEFARVGLFSVCGRNTALISRPASI